eukprot:jgi/Mesvir1/2486/Mv03053-RA.1
MFGYVYTTVRDAPGGWLMDQPGDHLNLITFTIPAGSYTLDGVVVDKAITGSSRLSFEPKAPQAVGTISDLGVTEGSWYASSWKTDAAVGAGGMLPVEVTSEFKNNMVSLFLRVPWGASGARIGRANLASLSIAADVDGVPLQVSAAFSEGNENAPKSALIFMLGYVYNTIRDAPGGWLMDQPGDHPNLFTFTIPAGSYSLDGVVVNRAITASARLSFVDIVDVPPEEPASDGTIEDLSPHLTAAWFLFVSPTNVDDVRARVPAASLGADGKWALTSRVYDWETNWVSSDVVLALEFSTVRTVSRGSVQAFVWDLMASNVSMAPGVDAFETTGTGKGAITTAYLRLGDIKALSSENGVDVLTSVNNIRVTLPAGLLEVEGVAINKDVRMTWNFDTSPAPTGTIQDLSTALSDAYLVFQSPTGALYGTVPAASKGADGVWSLNTPVARSRGEAA